MSGEAHDRADELVGSLQDRAGHIVATYDAKSIVFRSDAEYRRREAR
jgi:hypothetical protein